MYLPVQIYLQERIIDNTQILIEENQLAFTLDKRKKQIALPLTKTWRFQGRVHSLIVHEAQGAVGLEGSNGPLKAVVGGWGPN